ncbi:hypothetical protein Nepgr_000108 [Nepenthes gracilis]|uniref:Uncharacterized protein n=1 Tax=Nepenthes gracilis TaxID=150966 RepID=A0AAD3P5P2_NEPGR|nr:hypothetical protein Nepgr_000108 [Nepenthes gracilis]
MIMDSQFGEFSDDFDGNQFLNGTMSSGFNEPLNYSHLFDDKDPSFNPPSPLLEAIPNGFASSSSNVSPEAQSPDDSESDFVLKYISQMLMEENMEEKPCMFHDPLALQAAEKPFYDALGQKYPSSPNQHPFIVQYGESPDDYFSGSTSDLSAISSATTTNLVDPIWITDSGENEPSIIQTPAATQNSTVSQWSFNSLSSLGGTENGSIDMSLSMPMDLNFFSQRESMIQFQRGVEEASKFLPKVNNLFIDLENITLPNDPKEPPAAVVKTEGADFLDGSRGRKVHHREDVDFEDARSSKQSAVYVEENELSEMYDKVLLWFPGSCSVNPNSQKGDQHSLEDNDQSQGSDGGKGRSRKSGDNKNVVDLRNLLILCAQATASHDRRTGDELLKQIRQHSSPSGDGPQRLAHYFANALEARFAGTGSQIYTALASRRTTATDVLKAYQVFISACPFKKLSIGFAIGTILKVAEKATKLHIIDFGILYGFQWPILIKKLSEQPGGPPKLCITGIELPQPGFRPAERVEETGRRLAKYCERFKVSFEYHAIAQKWETIKAEDIKIGSDEVVAVNCLYRFKNLLDETIVVDSPRNAVLSLIRKIKPDIFVHGVVNGSFNAPFFITRFREALFHFSTLFDMLDANISREQPERLMYEKEFCGREIMNVVACEGTERVERPETYKQWQARNIKAGFRQFPLDPELMEKLRGKVKNCYHKDFLIDVDGHWVLQGWKGRIVYAMSAWVPS